MFSRISNIFTIAGLGLAVVLGVAAAVMLPAAYIDGGWVLLSCMAIVFVARSRDWTKGRRTAPTASGLKRRGVFSRRKAEGLPTPSQDGREYSLSARGFGRVKSAPSSGDQRRAWHGQ